MPITEAAVSQDTTGETTLSSGLEEGPAFTGGNSPTQPITNRNPDSGTFTNFLGNLTRKFVTPWTTDDSPTRVRSITIAIHNYHDAYGHLPQAAIVAEGSEHPHSWRIAILPYMENGQAIFDQYKFDEPWNSEHNTRVTADMPDIFRHSDQDANSTDSSVYVLTGESTFFEDGKTIGFEDVPDRISNTLMVFQAKRNTHWAQPVDIAFDKNNPQMVDSLMEQFLGYSGDAVIASRADASTTPLKVDEYDSAALRSMILIDDETDSDD